LIDAFGISLPQASLDFRVYAELAPENAVYDPRRKAYLRTPDFLPRLSAESSSGFLAGLLGVASGQTPTEAAYLGWVPPVAVVEVPSRHVDPSVLRAVLAAVKTSRSLDIDYQSMNRSAATRRRVTPHALAFDGSRWHFRAYCHEHLDFRDFLLARVIRVAAEVEQAVDPASDVEWCNILDVVLEANPELSPAQRRVVELDYGMESGRVVIPVREALMFYFLRRLGLDHSESSASRTQQITWANRGEFPLREGLPRATGMP